MSLSLKINTNDSVAVALETLKKGTTVSVSDDKITLVNTIPQKHKFSLIEIPKGETITMYGVVVGEALKDISKGELISLENVRHKTEKVNGKTASWHWQIPNIEKWKNLTFDGYPRNDGQVGTENIWLFFPLVFCENRNIQTLKILFDKVLNPPKKEALETLLTSLISPGSSPIQTTAIESPPPGFENIKIRFLTHQGGCGGTRQDAQSLAALLAGYVNNPNVAGATVLSLGCQNLEIKTFQKALATYQIDSSKKVLIFDQQTEGTTENFLKKILQDSVVEIKKANEIHRKPMPLNKLTIGLECGGSDGFSGITANPALGYVSDIIATLGGKAILAEFPELSGVEQELVNRCDTPALGEKFLHLMKAYEKEAHAVGSGFDMNPSPGNIKDGLITDAMKSAGAAKKSGSAPITSVLDYTEYAINQGIALLCTPGNDVESTTALAGSGANLILFTTGLGTPTGNPISPVIKVGTNTDLAQRMPDIIDFDAGRLISNKMDMNALGTELMELIIAVASGKIISKATALEQFDFIPWKRGVSL